MYSYYKAIRRMYENRSSSIILGLTGRTGSGCTTVANILKNTSYKDLDLKQPKTYDYNDADERKYELIYNFISSENNWKEFHVIEGSAIILSFVLEHGYEELLSYLRNLHNNSICKLDNLTLIETELKETKNIFDECKLYSLNDISNQKESLKDKNKDFYNFYLFKLPEYKKLFQDIFSKHICYPQHGDEEKAQLYTYLMQIWGNNVRASGNPYLFEFTQKNFFDVAKRINMVISIIHHNDSIVSKNICIDALRNPYEAIFFKDLHKNFFLVSILTEEKYRKNRISFLSKKEQDALEHTENPTEFDHTEEQFYHQNIQGCTQISDIHIYNPDVTNKKFYFLTQQLVKYVALIQHPGLITPTHIERCMQLAYNAKFNSGCLSRQVGAVITGNDFSIRAVGWNDVPKGQVSCNLRGVESYCANKDCESFSDFELSDSKFDESMKKIRNELKDKNLDGRTYSYCFKDVYNGYKGTSNQVLTRSLHAEENAFLQISKYGGSGIKDGFLFTTASPCELCAKKAYQLGITNIYYIDPYPGISMSHILTFGKQNNPKMNLFYGAIGNAYMNLYEPRMATKDELELVTGIEVKKVVAGNKEPRDLNSIEPNIKFIDLKLTLEYKSNEDIKSHRSNELTVTQEPINHIEKEIVWTGSRYVGTFLVDNTEGFSLEDSSRKISPYKYKVLFNKNLTKGETVTYKIVTKVSDENNDMKPFYSHTITNPTERLTLTIKFHKNMITNVRFQEYRDSGHEIKIGDTAYLKKEEDGDFEIYTHTIKNPSLLNTCCIEWEFLNQNNE